jgi:uncharacterized protein
MTNPDPVLNRFRAAVAEAYGARVERIVLYGSRARGEATPDSDYDIAVFLQDMPSRWQEFLKLGEIETAVLDETGAVVHAMPFLAGRWQDGSSPLMYEIRKDGLDL